MGEMHECEVKRPFIETGGNKTMKWVVKPVSSIGSTPNTGIRCMHCYGAVRVHKQQVEHGPRDHVEHLRHADSVDCRGGHQFAGTHNMSAERIE